MAAAPLKCGNFPVKQNGYSQVLSPPMTSVRKEVSKHKETIYIAPKSTHESRHESWHITAPGPYGVYLAE